WTAPAKDGNSDCRVSKTDALAWLDGFAKIVKPVSNGEAYQNYPNPRDKEFGQRYWKTAETLSRLAAVKKLVDAENLFHFPQSISEIRPEPDLALAKLKSE